MTKFSEFPLLNPNGPMKMAGCAIARFASPVNKTNMMILIIENGFEFLYLKIGDLKDFWELFGHTLTIMLPLKKHLTGTSYIVVGSIDNEITL